MGKKNVVFLLLAMAAGFGILLVPDAGAVRYTVTQCGWHVGMDASWADTSANKFSRSSYCQAPAAADPFENVHMTSETRGSTSTVGGTRFARWRWQAPAGTGIVTIHGQRWQILRDGFQHRIGGVTGNGFSPADTFQNTDLVKRDFAASFVPFASAVEARLLCAKPDDKVCSAESKSMAGVRGLTFTLDDSIKPSVSIGGGLTDDRWLRGPQPVNFSAGDFGSGLRFSQTLVDGAVRAQTEHPCSKEFIAGLWRGTRMQPCANNAAGTHMVQTSTLSDGPHQLRQCAIDFATGTGCTVDRLIRTDNTAPAAPRALTVAGGEGWQRTNGFRLDWAEPDQGVAAPIVSHGHRVSGPAYDPGPVWAFGNRVINDIQVPGAGEYRVSVWLVDQAGNMNPSVTADAMLRFDDVPPVAYFVEPEPARPEQLRVSVSDAHSGPVGGTIAYRIQGGSDWQALPAEFGGDGNGRYLKARFPSDEVPPGIYEFEARVLDAAGNGTVTTRRGNGSSMSMRAPTRVTSRLTARLRWQGSSLLALKVPFAGQAELEGRLTSPGGDALAGQRILVTQAPTFGSKLPGRTVETATDGEGFYSVLLDRGTSRRVSVSYPGTERVSGAQAGPLDLKVKGRISLRAKPKRLRTGRKLRLRGRVDVRWARPPARGNVVAVQYFERSSRRWRPVLVTRTNRFGRFRDSYRFRYITGIARIKLRAVLLPSQYFPFEPAASKPVRVKVRG
ncbi:MAG: carboxypeptidase-like regulatory domain-containing protein [Solirubrobacterales bacterium]